jgi:hypothetical protein
MCTINKDIEKYNMELSIALISQQTYSSGEKRFVNFINLYKRKQVEECLPATIGRPTHAWRNIQ